ncbi:MAG: GMP synthase subunit A [Thermoplasmata archaeon]
MKIPVLDNGGQWTHREYRVLRDLEVESRILPNTTPLEELDADGVVLSGGALSLEGSDAPLGRLDEWVDRAPFPILGICVGHQFLGRHFGGSVGQGPSAEFGRVTVTVDETASPVFQGLPSEFTAWSNHNDQVVRVPPGWHRLAHSETCPVQAMSHPEKPIVGVQFHPEVEHTEHGREIFRNFIAMCRR